ncbi:DNA methyltransferase [Bifidobacterium sp. SO1]|uniref:DNA methyltransferase n=1 Tax=Bifidobacterium sp. SO1 TaxID=2809029 RepID=UPI001BDC9AB8|nr:DNA methyltransferase [Bifidobacterium sp. SO1]MBT1162577.1 class I SAM-dependent DNA methyltransferase [Bifidobacterium sp. SO1]
MSTATINKDVQEFIDKWRGHGAEKQETQKFWLDLLQDVLHRDHVTDEVEFEHPTAGGGYVDVLFPDARFLIEQKSIGVDLDEPEIRQGIPVTPVEQALRYAQQLPYSLKPAVIGTCNFERFRFYDLDKDPLAKGQPVEEFTLEQLGDHLGIFRQLFSEQHSRIVAQEQLSVNAGRRVAKLHEELAKCFPNPDDEQQHAALAMITVRLVFCLYAEDARLFPSDSFTEYVAATTADRLGSDLYELFRTLDTPVEQRRMFLPDKLKAFPYVDGGLFADLIDVPPVSEEFRHALIDMGDRFDWSGISPVIFGSLMEETLSHDERRKGGMHYTTVKNIHRVIDPLFLDDLKQRLAEAENLPVAGGARTKALTALHEHIGSLRLLDPACGSGNFATESFICLRRLENQILSDLNKDGQLMLDLDGDMNPVKVTIDHFYGIEINGFACAVARTALWIAEQQMLDDTSTIITGLPRLPFTDTAHIHQGNALQYDWNELLPGDQCDYVMGNPPFLGHISKSTEQTNDLKTVWGKGYDGYLDYATGWFRKAGQYLTKPTAAFALVSTNSITQGQPVPALFKPIMDDGWRIRFAHRTFAWNAQSTDNANVHVVIIGMDRTTDHAKPPILFEYPNIDGEPETVRPSHINGYLLDGPDVYAEKRSQKAGPLSPMLNRVDFGSMPLDGGNLLINDRDEYDKAMNDPIAAKYVRPFRMGRELINNVDRWCLWLTDAPTTDILKSPYLKARVEACREYREHAPKSGDAYKNRTTPQLFRDNHQPHDRYLGIPAVFSGQRRWATCAWLDEHVIAGNKIYVCDDPDGFAFAIIESSMFITWQKSIGGRLKNDCNFSNTVVWNTLPLPQLSDDMREKVIKAGQQVIAARAKHPNESLADLYSPLLMHPDLLKAHQQLDQVVDVAFGSSKPCKADEERLQILFNRYKEMSQDQ